MGANQSAYLDVREMRRWVTIFVVVVALAHLFLVATNIQLWSAFQSWLNDAAPIDAASDQLESLRKRLLLLSMAISVPGLICAVVSGMWIYRASWNAGLADPQDGRMTPGWAVGWFIIPLANLVKPFVGIREAYNSSQTPPRSLTAEVPTLFNVWWLAWVATIVLGFGANIGARSASSIEGLGTLMVVDILASVLWIATLILWQRVVSRITDLQTALPEPPPGIPARPIGDTDTVTH